MGAERPSRPRGPAMAADQDHPAGPPTRDPNAQSRHDLRTPVNQILGYAELLQEEMEEKGLTEFVSDLQKIQTAARNQIELINRILAPPGAAEAPAEAPEKKAAAKDPGWMEQTAPMRRVAVVVPPLPESETAAALPVLVVDDNEMNRDMLSRRLKGRGYEVFAEEDGYKALEAIEAQSFATVILDVMMPGITGLDVLK